MIENLIEEKIYRLRHEQGMSFSEIAKSLNRETDFVRRAYNRAIRRIEREAAEREATEAEDLRRQAVRDSLGPLASIPVFDLGLSPRTYNALIAAGVNDLADLMCLKDAHGIRNIGDVGWKEIQAVQKQYEAEVDVDTAVMAELDEIKEMLEEAEKRMARLNLSTDGVVAAIDEINRERREMI